MTLAGDAIRDPGVRALDKHARIMVVRSSEDLSRLPLWEPRDQTFHLLLQAEGPIEIVGPAGRLPLEADNLVVLRPSASTTARIGEGAALIVLSFPASIADVPVKRLNSLVAVPVDASRGVPGALASLLRSLIDVRETRAQVALHLSDAVTSLLSAALVDPGADSDAALLGRSDAVFLAVRRWIEDHLHDHELAIGDIARAHHISVSYLQKIFANEGGSVSGWIRERRCERCRRDLADPAQRDVPIGLIAERWGFASAAHFSRVFAQHYGIPPRDYRVAALRSVRQASDSSLGDDADLPSADHTAEDP